MQAGLVQRFVRLNATTAKYMAFRNGGERSLRLSPLVHCEGQPDRGGASQQAPQPRQPPPQPPREEPIKIVPLEEAGSEAWAGVATLDKGEEGLPDWLQTGILVSGDALGLLVFAAIGRVNHGEVLGFETLGTALPFLIGWYSSAALLGGYGPEAKNGKVVSAATTAGKCWILGTPLGLGLRGVFRGYPPPTPFIIVSMVSTGFIMVGWRSVFAYLSGEKGKPSGSADSDKSRKKGGPFDFMKLLFNLTQRW